MRRKIDRQISSRLLYDTPYSLAKQEDSEGGRAFEFRPEVGRALEVSAAMLDEIAALEKVEALIAEGKDASRHTTSEERRMLAKAMHSTTHVYFASCKDYGLIKIGQSSDVKKRFACLRLSSPAPLTLLTYFRAHKLMEPYLHERYAAYRAHGEWFTASGPVLDLVEAAMEGGLKKVLDLLSREA